MRRIRLAALFVASIAQPVESSGQAGSLFTMAPNQYLVITRHLRLEPSGVTLPFGCHWEHGIVPTTDGNCPAKNFNSGKGQCSGGHPPNNSTGRHIIAQKPTVMTDVGPGYCANGDGRVQRWYHAPNFPGLYNRSYRVAPSMFDVGSVHDSYIFVALGGGEITPLIPLPVLNSVYTRVGGARYPWHNAGWGDPEKPTHWGTPALVASIQNVALDWFGLDAKSCGCNPCPILRINDMSLELGGGFDIAGHCDPPHVGHENGKKVDISSGRQHPNGVPADIMSETYFCMIAQAAGFSVICLERNPGDQPAPLACGDQSGCAVSSVPHWHLEVP